MIQLIEIKIYYFFFLFDHPETLIHIGELKLFEIEIFIALFHKV